MKHTKSRDANSVWIGRGGYAPASAFRMCPLLDCRKAAEFTKPPATPVRLGPIESIAPTGAFQLFFQQSEEFGAGARVFLE